MKIDIVIGANYGDEGKGRTVSFLAEQNPNSIVVRFNGGAQAAHRCVVNGTAHIFKHFGAGTMSSCRTFLTKDFLVNPILFFEELHQLQVKGFTPKVIFDNCPITTPYDMMINQWAEEDRGTSRHGSCGLGINETVTRQANEKYSLHLFDLLSPGFDAIIESIQKEYVVERCAELGIDISGERSDILYDERIRENFTIQCYNLLNYEGTSVLSMMDLFNLIEKKWLPDHLIFEGAQGLLLDQTYGNFPHVTRSNTGLTNISKYLYRYCPRNVDIQVHYVTRCYLTRHGNGPFDEDLAFPTIVDECNQPNPWQGTMRFGWLNIDLLSKTLYDDSQLLVERGFTNLKFKLNVTCLDQLTEYLAIRNNELVRFSGVDDFIASIRSNIHHVGIGYLSFSESGPMTKWKPAYEQARQADTETSI